MTDADQAAARPARPRPAAGPFVLGLVLLLGFAAGAGTATGTWLARDDKRSSCELTGQGPLRLAGCDLRAARLADADLRLADMRAVLLDGKDLSRLDLTGADLRGASMAGTVLRRTVLQGARLEGADLQGARIDGTCLRGIDVTPRELAELLAASPGPLPSSSPGPASSVAPGPAADTSACK